MVAPAPEEEVVAEETTPQPTKDSDSSESYEASPDDMPVSAGDVEIAVSHSCLRNIFRKVFLM